MECPLVGREKTCIGTRAGIVGTAGAWVPKRCLGYIFWYGNPLVKKVQTHLLSVCREKILQTPTE